MAEKQPNEDKRPSPVTARDLRLFAAKLQQLAKQYGDAADLLEETPSKVIVVHGQPTAERGVTYVRGWRRTVADAVDDLLIESQAGPAVEAAKIADEARRKGKGK